MNDQVISTALFSVRVDPLLISFSLILGEIVPNTMRSHIFLSECLGDQECKDAYICDEFLKQAKEKDTLRKISLILSP